MNVHSDQILNGILALVILISLAGVISACGKKGALEPPPLKVETKR